MKKFKPQHSRLLFIDRKIREGSFPNSALLAAEWEVNRKTILRDIDFMRNILNAPLSYSAKNRGYYYNEENFHLPAMALNDSDLFAIFIADKMLKQYENTPIYSRLNTVFDKIFESLPDKVTIDPVLLDNKFSFYQIPRTVILESVWETIFSALRSSHTVSISHEKPGSEIKEKRRIDPYHVLNYQGEWYVIGYCHRQKDIRTFALSRISIVETDGNSFTVPDDFDFKQTTRNSFGVQWSKNEFAVKIWFSPQAAPYIKERQWQADQQITENEDSSIIMNFTVSHLLEVKRWILSWGNQARVLAPQHLAEEVKEDLHNALLNY